MNDMVSHKRLLPVLLVAGLIVAGAVGPGATGSEASAVAEARTTIHTMVVPAAAFVPAFGNFEYVNGGDELSTLNGFPGYVAAVHFPYPEVTIKRITLYAHDNGSGDFTVHLGRSRPATGAGAIIATLQSSGQSTTDSRAFTTAAISPRVVNSAYHGVYLALFPPAGPTYQFYGVVIRYAA
ncbi:MAG: hypothetical protein JW785_07010 [Acidimicrobiia bacterium]|nr:hypothetical protein [Acidimicrobiia bacterium]